MTITNIAMIGIVLGFAFLIVGFLMEGPQVEADTPWNKNKPVHKRAKKRGVADRPRRRVA